MKDFPCMDDAPTNNGYSDRDWNDIRSCFLGDDEDEIEPESGETVIVRNDGSGVIASTNSLDAPNLPQTTEVRQFPS